MNLVYMLGALLLLTFIVVVHEFGHYLVGRLCGIRVLEFSVGMGPKLLGFTRNGIQYSLRLILIGGYCKFLGEDENNDDPQAMNSQKVWKRFLTVAAGPVMNFVLAFLVGVILFAAFYGIPMPTLAGVVEGTPAAEAGLMAGDVIVQVNGMEVSRDEAGTELLRSEIAKGQKVLLGVDRDGERLELELTPADVSSEAGAPVYQIGVYFGQRHYTLLEAVPNSLSFIAENSTMMLTFLRGLVFKGEGADDVRGPIGMVSEFATLAAEGWYMVFLYAFVITLNLGIINLLPLPALDGGRLVFLVIEGIRRKPVPPEKEGLVHAIGLILLLGLGLVVAYQDIARLIHG